MNKRAKFQPKPVSQAVGVFAVLLAATAAQAGPGFGDAIDWTNNPFIVQSYFASSPAGARQWDPATGAPVGYDPTNAASYQAAVNALYPAGYPGTGKALRKFVDPLPLPAGHALTTLYAQNAPKLSDGVTAKYIPVAAPVKWKNPEGTLTNDDYYEIAVVEYSEKFHADLKKATTLRGYVQIDQFATHGLPAPAGWVSKAVALSYPDGSPIMVNKVDASGQLVPGVTVRAKAVDNPHYLGPVLTASQGVPTRLKFLNLLPVGRAQTVAGTRKEFKTVYNQNDYANTALSAAWQAGAVNTWVDLPTTNVVKRNGDLFLPVDPSIVGAGLGPDGLHEYTQNRALIHLHGGDNPWISDGTPHQWITPAGEVDAANPLSVAADATLDPAMIGEYTRGVGAINVPDMFDPGPGAMTYYFPNAQSARMEWYHDHTVGVTRLNVYAGMASAYLLTDPVEQNLIATGKLPGAEATIPLVLQDKTFVPDDIALQDARWNTTAWGTPGDMWMPHVYETVQDPNQQTNFNAVGRWHWGPWFWPSFPAMYALPTGTYQDVTTTPESWMDTPLVNGVAYPTLTVDPKPYRLRILNASNDRTFTFNMFVADPTTTSADGRTNTEVALIPTGSLPTCTNPAMATRSDGTCFPANWANDPYGHPGGIPDPKYQGPTLMQVASEGGWLPGVATKDPSPISYLLDKGRAAVLNVDYGTSGLHIANAERADVVVDFTPYAGKTLIVYNDSGAPVPAADPRNEYFTGYGDQSATGGSEDTLTGYGPNSRTLMQINVAATVKGAAATTGDLATIDTAIKTAYAASQETPIVAQAAYNGVYNMGWTDAKAFARIYTGSVKEPAFSYVPGDLTPAVFNSVLVANKGSGYLTAPKVTLTPPTNGTPATAVASLKIDKLHVVSGGAGYRDAPVVTLVSNGKGSGAGATTRLKVSNVHVTSGGSGYGDGSVKTVTVGSGGVAFKGVTVINVGNATTNRYPGTQVPNVIIPAPSVANGVQATATAVMTGTGSSRRVASINITNPGSGYSGTVAVKLTAATSASVNGVTLPGVSATVGTVTLGYKAPTVAFTAAPAGGTTAAGTVSINASTGLVTGITITNKGLGYTAAPKATFSGGTFLTTGTPTATTTVAAVPTVTFARPTGRDGNGAPGQVATGVPVVDATGTITGVNIVNAGTGYTAMPAVTFSGTGATRATGVAYGTVSEVVLDIPDPTNPGTAGGGGYDNLLTSATRPAGSRDPVGLLITIAPPAAVPAAAGITAATAIAGATGKVFDISLTNSGSGYTAPPTVTVDPPAALPANSVLATIPAAAQVQATALTDTASGKRLGSSLVKAKAIQELFDPTYGRLNATFGVEIPFTSAMTQTTIPLGYVDQVTEEFQNGETQIWKITQNGVDTHPIHFHLLNVQLINRVGWDNFIQPPEPNELGWKETIKMSPLEDVIVAVRAKKPVLRQSSANGSFRAGAGFGLPNSVRRQDPSQPEGAQFGFTQIDPATGVPASMANTTADYGWEYTWHCHILGHEENDFMRPVKFNANEAAPAAATGLALDSVNNVLSWTDAADTEFVYTVEVDTVGAITAPFSATVAQTLPANSTKATVMVPAAGSTYRYRVTATGQAGSVSSQVLTVTK